MTPRCSLPDAPSRPGTRVDCTARLAPEARDHGRACCVWKGWLLVPVMVLAGCTGEASVEPTGPVWTRRPRAKAVSRVPVEAPDAPVAPDAPDAPDAPPDAAGPGSVATAVLPTELDVTGPGADWPQMFGPESCSVSRELGLNWSWVPGGPPLLWRRPLGAGYSAPVVHRRQLIVQYREGDESVIESLDTETGRAQWSHRTPTHYHCKYPYSSGPYATPTILPDRVLTITADGICLALRLSDGVELWRRDLLTEFHADVGAFGFGVSPKVWHDRILLNVGGTAGAGLVALSTASGETLWTATDDKRSYATAAVADIAGEPHAFMLTARGLNSVDPRDGRVRWFYPFGVQDFPERSTAVTPLILGRQVVISSGPGPGTVVFDIADDGSCRPAWKHRRVLDGQYTNLLHLDGQLIGVTSRASAVLRGVDLATGEMRWEYSSDLCRANTLWVDQHLIVLGEHGHLALLQPTASDAGLIWMSPEPITNGPCYSQPALAYGRLLVRTEAEIACFDLRPSP